MELERILNNLGDFLSGMFWVWLIGVAIVLFVFYLIIKAAVKNGYIEAKEQIAQRQREKEILEAQKKEQQ